MRLGLIVAAVMLLILSPAEQAYCQGVKNADNSRSTGKVVADRRDDLNAKMLDSVKYYLPEFKSGAIAFNNGEISRGVLNVSTVTQRVMFVDTEGKILELADNNNVKLMSVGRVTFVKFREKFVQIVKSIPSLDLGVTKKVTFLEAEKPGAYGTASVTASVQSYSSYSTMGENFKLDENITTPFIYNEYLYLHRNGKFYSPDLKTFKKLYPDKKEAIEAYVSENKVHFDSLDDVSALMDFLK